MKTIQLYGELADKFGSDPIMLDAATPQMITRGLISRFGLEFRKIISAGTFEFLCINSNTDKKLYIHDEMTAQMSVDHDEIHITPKAEGSGKFGQIIMGVVLIVVGVVITGMSFGLASPIGGAFIAAGIGMIAGGVVQLLIGSPTPDSLSNERPDSRPSYIFNGSVNTYEQGGPCPLVYGRIRAGSVIVSAGFEAARQSYNQRCGRRYNENGCDGPRQGGDKHRHD